MPNATLIATPMISDITSDFPGRASSGHDVASQKEKVDPVRRGHRSDERRYMRPGPHTVSVPSTTFIHWVIFAGSQIESICDPADRYISLTNRCDLTGTCGRHRQLV